MLNKKNILLKLWQNCETGFFDKVVYNEGGLAVSFFEDVLELGIEGKMVKLSRVVKDLNSNNHERILKYELLDSSVEVYYIDWFYLTIIVGSESSRRTFVVVVRV